MKEPLKKNEIMEIDISFLPEPTQTLTGLNFKLRIWGWVGFDICKTFTDISKTSVKSIVDKILLKGNGVYFVLVEDLTEKKFIFFCDLFSCKKIFYLISENKIILADFLYKLKSILNTVNEFDSISLGLYLLYGYIPTNRTLYKHVRSLKPFHLYEIKNNKLSSRKYFDIEFEDQEENYESAIKKIFSEFEKSFLAITSFHDHFFIPLSGGRDSRLLMALALKHKGLGNIKTFTFGQNGTFDFEIGRGVAKEYGVAHCILPFEPQTYFEDYIVPGTKFKNGLINHTQESPSKIYDKMSADIDDRLIISGYIGDAVLAWAHEKSFSNEGLGFIYPKFTHFNFEEVIGIIGSANRDELLAEIVELTEKVKTRSGAIEPEKWLYTVHAPCFTNPTLFSDEMLYATCLPFVEPDFLKFIFTISKEVKKRESFYRDVLETDQQIFKFFEFPLKNLRGKSYSKSPIKNQFTKVSMYLSAIYKGARPMKNYINFNKVYSDDFFQKNLSSLGSMDIIGKIGPIFNMSYKKKVLLLSLKLNLGQFFN